MPSPALAIFDSDLKAPRNVPLCGRVETMFGRRAAGAGLKAPL